ncbi:type III secretion system outer membrane ring subunit SctC [Pseudomonas sp. ADAK18]|uniref:type III secretion system outer membrane ring subunit SctC n=1 Tax=Pseudomonas sp. ADAK18 TaxID=2730848 RepID=UPI00146459DA|nr:type III secretion system outer membrane ring subunit SctC [Pseudomonas sp. ADAK18]QJI32739.1 type III secretion system outer membrane ring subunit SctC [Pseudomonas sp. ADAK18]
MLGSAPVVGEAYQARDENLHTFFTALSVPLGQPIVVSPAVARKHITGAFDFSSAQRTLEDTAVQQGLIWYSDGQVLYLYDASEAKSSVVALRHISVDRLRGFMRRSGLSEARYPLREGGARMFSVSGPANYVDQVLRLAQLMDRRREELRTGAQKIGVVQVLNTHVADRQYAMGDEQVSVPGMASMIEKLLAAEQKNTSPSRSGLLADKNISVMAYPDTNSLLIKGKPEQVRFIENLVAELDVPKRSVEVSLWLVDVDRDELKKIGMQLHKEGKAEGTAAFATRALAPLEDNAFMSRVTALERRRRAKVVTLPVILTQENVPAVFHDNQTFYLPRPGTDSDEWQPVIYGTQVSVLPRFAEANEIEMQLSIEDGRQLNKPRGGEAPLAAVGHIGINTVVRVSQGNRLWVGDFPRAANGAARGASFGLMANSVRLFVIQARAVGDISIGPGHPPPLAPSQYQRVKRAFVRSAEL